MNGNEFPRLELVARRIAEMKACTQEGRFGLAEVCGTLAIHALEGFDHQKAIAEGLTPAEKAFSALLDDLKNQTELGTKKIKAGDIDGSLSISISMFNRLGSILDKAKAMIGLKEMDTGSVDMVDKPLGKPMRRGVTESVELPTFAGHPVFDVDEETFVNARLGKTKTERYAKVLANSDKYESIREYGRKNPGKKIILRNSKTGVMSYYRNYD